MGAYGSKRFRADLQALKDNDPTLQVSDKSIEPRAAVTMCLGGLASQRPATNARLASETKCLHVIECKECPLRLYTRAPTHLSDTFCIEKDFALQATGFHK